MLDAPLFGSLCVAPIARQRAAPNRPTAAPPALPARAAAASPEASSYGESVSTLTFAKRVADVALGQVCAGGGAGTGWMSARAQVVVLRRAVGGGRFIEGGWASGRAWGRHLGACLPGIL